MSLESKLTEEEKEIILQEVERERRKVLVGGLYEKGMKNIKPDIREGTAETLGHLALIYPDRYLWFYKKWSIDKNISIRVKTAGTLGSLAAIDKEMYLQLYEKGISDKNISIREKTAGTLEALASIDKETYLQLYKKGISDDDILIRRETAKTLRVLASIDKEMYLQLYEKGLKDDDETIRGETAKTLVALAIIDPKIDLQLFGKGLKNEDKWFRLGTTRTIGALASVNTELYLQLYKQGLKDGNSLVKIETTKTLGALASVNTELYLQLYKQGLKDQDFAVRKGTAGTLGALASINAKLYLQLYENGLKNKDFAVRKETAGTLGALASINPEKYLQLYQKGLKDDYRSIREETAKTLRVLALSVKHKILVPLQNTEYNFLVEYLNSKYVNGKTKKEIKNELIYFVRKSNRDYEKLTRILKTGEAQDLDEIVECGNISSSYKITCRLGSGAAGITYKAYSRELKQFRAIKIINPKKVNQKEAELMARLQGKDLDNIVQIHEASNQIATVSKENRFAIVMEYVDGKTLREIIDKGKLPPDQVLDYSVQIFNGILSLQHHGIVHRDINPQNVKVNSKSVVKIIDFGIATDEPKATGKAARRYGVPENQEANDFFSLGMLTYKMATGQDLIREKKEGEGSQTHANETFEKKKLFYYSKNRINGEFSTKIETEIHLEIRPIIFSCFEFTEPEVIQQAYIQAREDLKYHFMKKEELIAIIKELKRNT